VASRHTGIAASALLMACGAALRCAALLQGTLAEEEEEEEKRG
jgi:hypothetical protein